MIEDNCSQEMEAYKLEKLKEKAKDILSIEAAIKELKLHLKKLQSLLVSQRRAKK